MRRILLMLFLSLAGVSVVLGQLPDNEILTQVFRVRIGQEFGTAFTIDVDSQQYLVTVDHLLPAGCPECTLEIWLDNAWQSLNGRAIRPTSSDVAAVALALNEKLSPESTPWSAVDEIELAQQVYFIGFPFGLRTAETAGARSKRVRKEPLRVQRTASRRRPSASSGGRAGMS